MKSTKLALLSGMLACFSLHCGGPDLQWAEGSLPPLDPVRWFTGQWEGSLLIFDRNGNLRKSGTIRRSCGVPREVESTCSDRVLLHRNSAFETVREMERVVSWRAHYNSDNKATVWLDDGWGELQGDVRGGVLIASGERLVPAPAGQEPETASATARFQLLPRDFGEPERMVQWEEFHSFGVYLGRREVHWRRP